MNGVKDALEVTAVAQKLVKSPERNAKQDFLQDFVGSTKFWHMTDLCLTTKDAKHWLTRLCMCKRREVSFCTFPICLWLHKPASAEPEVARPACSPNSSHSSINLSKQQYACRSWNPPWWQRLYSVSVAGWKTPGGVCTHGPHATDKGLHLSDWFAALLLHYPKCFTFAAEFGFQSSVAALSLCCHPSKESQVWHESVCLVSFM